MGFGFRRKRSVSNDENVDYSWDTIEIDNTKELTLLSACCQIVDLLNHLQYDDRIYQVAARPISFIKDKLSMTERQAVIYAVVMDMYYENTISYVDLASSFNLSPLKAMEFVEDMAELSRRRYLTENIDEDAINKSYSVTKEAMKALQNNCVISVPSTCVNNPEEWFNSLEKILTARTNRRMDYDVMKDRIEDLVKQNREMPMLKRFDTKNGLLTIDERMLFFWTCGLYVCLGYENIVPDNFRKLFGNLIIFRTQRQSLANGTNGLIKHGLLRIAQSSEQKSKECYELTPWVIKVMLAELELESNIPSTRDILEHTTITPKDLFYNEKEQKAIDQLSRLLQPDRFEEVCNELHRNGFRKGFACLFHGAPGTGKTETVLQLARTTGRNLMQVNISEIKSMWVGESEKNIKAIFTRYRKLVEESDVAPILLFNEADAIISKRLENVSRSVDKMENSIQNIILEEIEKLDGILIATTNLTSNMDTAFERRFLYKIEFEKPSIEVKSAIWQSMLAGLSAEDAKILASTYDFSGGQIENIARKSFVNKIISGEDMSLNSLMAHCDTEMIGKSNYRRVGF